MKRIVWVAAAILALAPCAWSVDYEASVPVLSGGTDAGFLAIVFTNRDPSTAVEVRVQVTAVDRKTGQEYRYAVSSVTVEAAQLNSVTGDLAQAGAQMLHWDLRTAGFASFRHITARVQVINPPQAFAPLFTWTALVTARRESRILSWLDHRRFKVLP